MKTTTISKAKYRKLNLIDLPKHINNSEGKLLELDLNGTVKAYKSLYVFGEAITENKLYTINELYNNKEHLPNEFVLPDNLIEVDDRFDGFTTPLIVGTNLSLILDSKNIPNKEKIHYLKEVGRVLDNLKQIRKHTPVKELYINDLHSDNIMIDTNKEIKFIDLDSSRINDNKPFPSKFLCTGNLLKYVNASKYQIYNDEQIMYEAYNDKRGFSFYEANENTDLFCYIIMILNFLYGDNVNKMTTTEFYNYINYLEKVGFNNELINSFMKIVDNCDNFNPVKDLDSLNDEQIVRAKKIVYKNVILK